MPNSRDYVGELQFMSQTVLLWRAQVAQYRDGTPNGLLNGLARQDKELESVSSLADRIWSVGLPDPLGQQWQFPDMRQRRGELKSNPSLYSTEAVAQTRGFFCTADRDTAAIYADRYSRNHTVLVGFMAPVSELIVDCRDFLDRIFIFAESFFREGKSTRIEEITSLITRYWGLAISEYLAQIGGPHCACDLVNAAAHDPRIVDCHLRNQFILCGRSGTLFRNQRACLTSISPGEIKYVESDSDSSTLTPDVKLHDVLFPEGGGAR